MARPKKYKIELTDEELKSLKSVIRKNKISKTIRCRRQIIMTWMSLTEKYCPMSSPQNQMVYVWQL